MCVNGDNMEADEIMNDVAHTHTHTHHRNMGCVCVNCNTNYGGVSGIKAV